MARTIKQPLLSDSLFTVYSQAIDAVQEARKVDETVRKDWMQDNDICADCEGKGTIRYRPTLDYMNEFVTTECDSCKGTGHISCQGKPIDILNVFPMSQEYCDAVEVMNRASKKYRTVQEIEKNPRGHTVRVVSGRKVPIGTIGRVFWVGENQWGVSVGIETPEGRKFTAITNVRVVFDTPE